jgi:hypothetical protein
LALDEALGAERLAECGERRLSGLGGDAKQPADHWHLLLRARGERPSGCRTPNHFDEIAPSHCVPKRSELANADLQ